jgi:hypothetical protein
MMPVGADGCRSKPGMTTLRRSSPYSLIRKKNSASYDRRVAQRRRGLADIAALKGTQDAGTSRLQLGISAVLPSK